MGLQGLEITNEKGYKLHGFLELPDDRTPERYALLAHCFTCNSNFNSMRTISSTLAGQGFGVVRFDFTGLGRSEGRFSESHFTSNVGDLISVARDMVEHHGKPELLIGHSLGGAAVIAAAAQLDYVKAIATIGTPYSVDHVQQHFRLESADARGEEWQIHIGGRPFTINKQFVEEMEKTDLHTLLNRLHKPILFAHAPGDEIVPLAHAHQLYQSAKHPKSFLSLDSADHLLSKKSDAIYAANVIAAWAERYLNDGSGMAGLL